MYGKHYEIVINKSGKDIQFLQNMNLIRITKKRHISEKYTFSA